MNWWPRICIRPTIPFPLPRLPSDAAVPGTRRCEESFCFRKTSGLTRRLGNFRRHSLYRLPVSPRLGVAYIQRPVYNYVLTSSSITRRFQSDTLAVNRQIFRAFSRLIQGYTGDGDWQNAYYALVIRRLEESLRLYFFHPQNPDPLSRRLSMLRKTLQARPYCTAICRADRRKLSSSQKKMLFFLRLPWPGGLWFFYWLKARIRRI